MKLTNRGPLDLDRVDVTVIPAHRAHEAVIDGIYDPGSGGPGRVQETGMLRLGESWRFNVVPARDVVDGGRELDRGGTAAFRCVCHARGYEPWEVIVSVELPPTPRIF